MNEVVDDLFERLLNDPNTTIDQSLLIYEIIKESKIKCSKYDFMLKRLNKDINVTKNYLNASIEDLQEANEEISKVNNELSKMNRNAHENLNKLEIAYTDLEQFAYITTHDLKQPLRTILNFVGLLKSKKGDQLDLEAKMFIRFILDSGNRLDNLINDMLAYSVIGKSGNSKEFIDTQSLISNVLKDIETQINDSNAEVTFDKVSEIFGFQSDLRSLFQNLISNAIKYSKPDVAPKVHISFIENKNAWFFSIEDNGIGFDSNQKEKIFNIFQRLENARHVSGTGIGLAHCKKIVELHGGKIWAESVPDKGSKFSFYIPKFEMKIMVSQSVKNNSMKCNISA